MNQSTNALAGLGLFFTGLNLLAASMQPLAGGKMRAVLSRMVSGQCSSALFGSLLGLITQSTTASTFVCIGLLNSGALPFRTVLNLVGWASVGTSMLVFLAAVDVRMAGIYIVSMVGVAHLFNAGRHLVARQIIAFLFALGVLFLGLGMIKDVSSTLRSSEWAVEFVQFSSESGLIGFLVGIVVTLITQSSASVTILAVTLNLAGILPFGDAVIIVYGSSIGSGLSVVLATSHLNAKQRKISIYQCLVKILGVVVLMPVGWILDDWLNEESIQELIKSIPVGTWIAILYLLLQVVGALTASLLQIELLNLLEKLCPPSEEEQLFEPMYIYAEAATHPDTALILAMREQDRLLMDLANCLDPIRPEAIPESQLIPPNIRYAATNELAGKIRAFLEETLVHNRSDEAIESIFKLQNCNESIRSLQDSLKSFVETFQSTTNRDTEWAMSMIEGLHLILVILKDALAEGSDDSELLFALTMDRSKLMENVRNSLLTQEFSDLTEKQSLFIGTSIFERIIWLVRQIAISRFPENKS